ncbi:MAG: Asp-tRNA(Asn)/Glu-tRNA(Gln) amidotransferase subunit GatC [Salibacteraceae bacterium]|jgi:aspartyl-tRNA(Asn)/glutamyl-tRNA(Gln) amidotransferase subunit C|nr:Asp-tRNA(Asn)/Glu-tRNA(Gln) amidotransferase subunit GatC [Salibacteraceae bacterium]MDP4686343.1 Asp-tRNA(Asn)/Glu-tRNA(Gln) amidotransferase subunit GatC [Salibacteraceae bacterium]MDP4763916.1 Asp-tRNA(Asn)/Glu-tRNA(Gln) amidotransferase subunit GatC [Salibacteraceae bacterium]MDP4935661.1 Asp-tRNA(Asn)/Glu-tRNA(Gln) amidotransferase subunit GatC [Salibacteraceae bacterium]
MEITDKTIDKLADLARLNFEGERKAEIKQDLERMLNFVDKLNELNTDGLEPLVYMTNEPLVLRKDEIGEELTQAQALKNAPSKDSDYFKVPKVLDK